MPTRTRINQHTWIPLGVAVVAIGGGGFWLSALYSETRANAATVMEIKSEQSKYSECITTIRQDISEIKGELRGLRKDLRSEQ